MFNIENLIKEIQTDWKDLLFNLIQPYKDKINKELSYEYDINGEDNIKTPRSLNNIFKELYDSYNIKRTNNNLEDWTQQGVLMLNTSLTVIDSKSGSHMKIWKEFTNSILVWISNNINKKISILLWGNYPISYKKLFINENFNVLIHTHPSPLSRK